MYNSFYGGFDLMFGLFDIFFLIVFVLVIGTIVMSLVRGAAQRKRDDAAPVLTVEAEVVAKRMDLRTHRRGGTGHHMGHTTSRTFYYATFQVESGDRMELEVPDMEYGLLVEGDRGRLTFQGTRFQGFRRT